MGNLESVARLHCQSLNCKNGVNKVRLDPLPEILYCKITVCSTCPASLWKSDTTEKHPFIRQTAKRGQAICNHTAATAALHRILEKIKIKK